MEHATIVNIMDGATMKDGSRILEESQEAATRKGTAAKEALRLLDEEREATMTADTIQRAVRWICSRRRCPLTTPESPF